MPEPHAGDEAPVVRIADPAGSYRRRIRMVTTEPGVVVGGLEDDFHHFEVELRHADGIVTHVDAYVAALALDDVPGGRPPARTRSRAWRSHPVAPRWRRSPTPA